VLEKLAYVGLGVAALLLGYGVLAMAAVMLVGAVAGVLLDLWWLRCLANDTDVHTGWQGFEVKNLFVRALPFFSVLFFGAIYFRVDVVILSLLTSDAVVGYYGAAYRLFQTTYIVPEAFLFALFPLFCRLSPRPDDALAVASQKGLDVLLLMGLPLATGMFVLSDEIILTLYGARFAASVPLLRVLSVAVALMYANGVFVQLLIATERQKRLAATAAAAAVLNVSLNFALIPFIGALGAAAATVATESLVILLNFGFLPRELTRQLRFKTPAKAMVASAVMAGVLVLLNGYSLLLLVPVGVVTYFAGIVVLRAVSPEDWAMIKTALANLGGA
jgi:O-antigen/teichoic acid export membrane protein